MSLKARLAREIALTGPMTVADYVTRCLHDPQDGYYATRPALGEGGDFITAPLV
ncbi:MAG: SAM-dependent methyltransferase, partial [Brevundimonas sp.]